MGALKLAVGLQMSLRHICMCVNKSGALPKLE